MKITPTWSQGVCQGAEGTEQEARMYSFRVKTGQNKNIFIEKRMLNALESKFDREGQASQMLQDQKHVQKTHLV